MEGFLVWYCGPKAQGMHAIQVQSERTVANVRGRLKAKAMEGTRVGLSTAGSHTSIMHACVRSEVAGGRGAADSAPCGALAVMTVPPVKMAPT